MAVQYKQKTIEETNSRNLVRVMIFITWISFVISVWIGILEVSYLFLAAFWLIVLFVLAALLSITK